MSVLRESFTKKGISERSTCWENISSVVGLKPKILDKRRFWKKSGFLALAT